MTKSWPFCFAILQPPCELSSAQRPPYPSCWSSGLRESRPGWWGPIALMEETHDQGELEKTSLVCLSLNPRGQGLEKVVSKLRQNFLPSCCLRICGASHLYVFIFVYLHICLHAHIDKNALLWIHLYKHLISFSFPDLLLCRNSWWLYLEPTFRKYLGGEIMWNKLDLNFL